MFHKIKTNIKSILFSKQCKKSLFFILFSFAIFSFWFDVTFASDAWWTEGSDEMKLVNELVWFLQHIIAISTSLLWWLTALIAVLLDPAWTNGSLFDISQYLHKIWIFTSNLIYLIFAWILIAISFMNIIWKWSWDIFELKKALPKFIVWVLIVPFSWFIVQFVMSMASILTVSVYTWPFETLDTVVSDAEVLKKPVTNWCTDRVINLQWWDSTVPINLGDSAWTATGFFVCADKSSSLTLKDILYGKKDDGSVSVWWIIWLYTFWIMEVWSLDKIKKDDFKSITTLMKLWAKSLFDIVFVVIYLIILLALFLALFVRVIMLWIYICVSPIFGLSYFLWKWKLWDKLDKLSFKEFFALAMVPVYVSAAMSFWLMFLFVIWKGLVDTQKNPNFNLEKFQVWTVTVRIQWSWADSTNKDSVISTIFWWTFQLLWYLMFKMMGLTFLWLAVMAAFKQSSITHSIVKPFEEFWNQVWKFAMESPKYIPIPGTGWLSLGGMQNVAGQVSSWLQQKSIQSSKDVARRMWIPFMEDNKALAEEIKKLKDIKTKYNGDSQEFKDALQNFILSTNKSDLVSKRFDIADILENTKLKDFAWQFRSATTPEQIWEVLNKANNSEASKDFKWNYLLWKETKTWEDAGNVAWTKPVWSTTTNNNQTNNFDFKQVNFAQDTSIDDKAGTYLAQMKDKWAKLTKEKVIEELESVWTSWKEANEIAEAMARLVTDNKDKKYEWLIIEEKKKWENSWTQNSSSWWERNESQTPPSTW